MGNIRRNGRRLNHRGAQRAAGLPRQNRPIRIHPDQPDDQRNVGRAPARGRTAHRVPLHIPSRTGNYTSIKFAERLSDNGILPSMDFLGDSYVMC